jgi:hypothetical protein
LQTSNQWAEITHGRGNEGEVLIVAFSAAARGAPEPLGLIEQFSHDPPPESLSLFSHLPVAPVQLFPLTHMESNRAFVLLSAAFVLLVAVAVS